MKKIILTSAIFINAILMNAQTIKVYEYDSEGNLNSTPAYTSTNKVKVVFEDANNSYKYQNLKAGDKVEGTVTVNGTSYTKAVGGTVADYVDLGIVVDGKKVLWATHNLGASKPEEYGAYIAWGENGTEEEGYSAGVKTTGYYWSTLKYCSDSNGDSFTKYVTNSRYGTVDNITTLESQDDAATVNWGSNWRTPTDYEWTALNNTDNFTWTWNDTNGGYTVTSKISGYEGKSIFLPAAGYRNSLRLLCTGSKGYYWWSSIGITYSYYAYRCYFGSDYHVASGDSRDDGFSVRPVHTQN